MILHALAGDSPPVYGDGHNVRNWLFVEDFAQASGARYGTARRVRSTTAAVRTGTNDLTVVHRILELTDRDKSLIEFVTDRPGHDHRCSCPAPNSKPSDGTRGPLQ